jgi:hypothetical protein
MEPREGILRGQPRQILKMACDSIAVLFVLADAEQMRMGSLDEGWLPNLGPILVTEETRSLCSSNGCEPMGGVAIPST